MNDENAPRREIIEEYARRKGILDILRVFAFGGLLLGIASWLLDSTLTQLPENIERALYLLVAIIFTVAAIIYWRCPSCDTLLWFRMAPKSCPHCGIKLVASLPIYDSVKETEPGYYIRLQKANSLRYWLWFICISAITIGLAVMLIDKNVPVMFLAIVFFLTFIVPFFIINKKYRICPKCGYSFHYQERIPKICPECHTLLKGTY